MELGRDVIAKHCSPEVLEDIEKGIYSEIYTTWRDPLRVAASWGNRGRLGRKRSENLLWFEQWGAWHRMMNYEATIIEPQTHLGGFPDKLNLHHYLDIGDMDSFYKIVPREFIEAAWQ